MTRSSLTDITVILKHETQKAWLLDCGELTPIWLPKSQGELELNPDKKTWTLTLEQHVAEEKGFI